MGRAGLLAVLVVSPLLCAVWSVYAGKDLNWDLLNYHLYAPYHLVDGRLEKDFFGASAQGYLNPVGYLPFYLMVMAGWHSVIVSMVLAAAHGLALAFLCLIAWRLFAHRAPRERALLACLAGALGAASVVFWATVGTSFLDPLLTVPMLGGLLLLLGDDPARAVRRALWAGVLFGAAAALKYSNAIYVIAALPLSLAMPGAPGRPHLRAGLAFAGGAALSLAALALPWMVLMAREFGNPAFPLMNAWFPSPYQPAVNFVAERFAPKDLLDAVTLPFRMALPDRVYAEVLAPDLRFGVLALAALAAALPVIARRLPRGAALQGADWRLFAFFAAVLVLWLGTSANGRYGMVVLLLAGVCLARMADRMLPPAAVPAGILVVIAAQGVLVAQAATPRWALVDRWSSEWLTYEVPERARREPALYLTVETLPMAVIAPFLHRDSSFINVRGQYAVKPEWPQVQRLFARHREQVRVLGRALRLQADGRPANDVVRAYDSTLLRFGYRVDPGACFVIPWRRPPEDWLSRLANRLAGEPQPLRPTAISVATCALVPGQRDPRDLADEQRISALFDRVEKACRGLLRGQTAQTEPLGHEWSRNYQSIEARLETSRGRVGLMPHLSFTGVDLGGIEDWERDPGFRPDPCR